MTAAGASSGASEDSREVVLASEILAAIERGEPVDYDGVIVEGDLDLSGRIFGSVDFDNTVFLGSVDFQNTIFTGYSTFERSNFSGDASFSGAKFGGWTYFSRVNFSGNYTNFQRAKFGWGADFSEANFSGVDTSFQEAKFASIAIFSEAKFSGEASFREVEFGGSTHFGTVEFCGDASFIDANFSGEYTSFWGAEFASYAFFSRAKFYGDTTFSEATFGRDAYFEEAKFDGNAYFYKTEFGGIYGFLETGFIVEFTGGNAHFKDAEFGAITGFNYAQFNGTADFAGVWFIKDATFENAIFRGELSLIATRYDKLFIRWHSLEKGIVYDDIAYLSLLKNFRDLNYLEDYDNCYFEYRKDRRSMARLTLENILFKNPIDYFLQVSYGYGTKPLRTLGFSLMIILVFGIFWRSIGLGRPNEALDEYTLSDFEHDSILEVLAFSATVFLSGTRLFIDPPPLPKIRGRSRSLIRGAFIFERVLGALFSILFFLAISGTVVRQL